MSCSNQQQLFLIEFIIHQVNIPTVRAMHDEVLPNTQTCVSFQVTTTFTRYFKAPPINFLFNSSLLRVRLPLLKK